MKDEKRNTYSIDSINSNRTGVFMGTGIGGVNALTSCFSYQILSRQKQSMFKILEQLKKNKEYSENKELIKQFQEMIKKMIIPKRFNPFSVSMIMPNACSANLGIKFNIHGKNNTFCSSCASGTVAIGHGFNSIKKGDIDLALVGGAEYMRDEYGALFHSFDIINTLTNNYEDDNKANRPFDENRTGFLFSEGGGAILVIEELNHAEKRGANIIAEIIGYEEVCDAHNIMMMDKSGSSIIRMINNVLSNANITKDKVDYINAHGTGTILNDIIESNVIEKLFRKNALINSTKSLLGHTLGASGAIEAVVTALSIQNKKTHICKNLENPIKDLNFVTSVNSYPINTAISQSFGFGGHNAILVFSEFK